MYQVLNLINGKALTVADIEEEIEDLDVFRVANLLEYYAKVNILIKKRPVKRKRNTYQLSNNGRKRLQKLENRFSHETRVYNSSEMAKEE
jgi:DNA-binding PadR family transcriptional regulator